jgi:hypothetical protein
MQATIKQAGYIASLITKNKSDDVTLQTICNSIPKNNEKYPDTRCDHSNTILSEYLLQLTSYEANDIIEYFTKSVNRFGKRPRVMQMHIPLNRIFKHLIK